MKVLGFGAQAKYLDAKQNVIQIGASVPVGPSTFRAGYVRVDMKGTNAAGASIDANDANQFAVGYQYDLSKRTALYSTFASIKNKGAATYTVQGTTATASSPALPFISGGQKSQGFEAGIRHSF